MPDVHDPATRSRNMAAIRGKNTKPELMIRSGLHQLGYRFRVAQRDLPGKPDLVLKRFRAVIFVNGCFWHGHACELFRLPGTRTEFWAKKIEGNRQRDARHELALTSAGWRQAIVWECALKGKNRLDPEVLFSQLSNWLNGSGNRIEIKGH